MRACLVAVGSLFALGLGLMLSVPHVAAQKSAEKDKHDPANAVANLEVHKDVKATLFASEPLITNPTNIDIDPRGRVWLCDVVNYRGNNGKRPEGDRILILEADAEGKTSVKTFYQGRDIDSAIGLCVLGNKVIVSCSPNIWLFTFDETNDKILKKEALFTKTGGANLHSTSLGRMAALEPPAAAASATDRQAVIDIEQPVNSGRPFMEHGLRCDVDGSNFEVLGYNFITMKWPSIRSARSGSPQRR